MSTKKKQSKTKYYRFLLDLIAIIFISTFAYTTSMIVVAYQMGY
ncbi:MAG: hypothetical protein WD512_10735 [Candidatus Paceibacterota bacterium]